MQIYVAVNDQKAGPFTLFKVEERLRSGEFTDEQLGWYDGLAEWRPLRELAPFESFFRLRDEALENDRRREAAEKLEAYREKRAASVPETAVRPWTRFWARCLDLFFFQTLCLLVFVGLREAGWLKNTPMKRFGEIFPVFLPLWHLIEAYLISQWGTTAGKALLGIHITDAEGKLLSYRASLRRSLGVYVLGMGCYLPVIMLVAMMFGFHGLWKKRRNFWDVTAESYVQHAPFQARHILMPLAIIFMIQLVFNEPLAELTNEPLAELTKEIGELFKRVSGEGSQTL